MSEPAYKHHRTQHMTAGYTPPASVPSAPPVPEPIERRHVSMPYRSISRTAGVVLLVIAAIFTFFSVSLGIIYCFIFIYYLLYSFSFSEYLFQNLVLSLCFSPFLWVYATVSSYLLSWNSFSEYLFQKLFLQVSLSLFVTHCLSIAPIILYLLPNFTNRVPLFYLGKFYRLCNVLQLPKHPS